MTRWQSRSNASQFTDQNIRGRIEIFSDRLPLRGGFQKVLQYKPSPVYLQLVYNYTLGYMKTFIILCRYVRTTTTTYILYMRAMDYVAKEKQAKSEGERETVSQESYIAVYN
jgi:hypothetical protein